MMLERITEGPHEALRLKNILTTGAAVASAAAATSTAIATATPDAAPAGGTGAAAGAWDTAANRDAAIATINGLRDICIEVKTDHDANVVDVASLRTQLNALLAELRTRNIIAP